MVDLHRRLLLHGVGHMGVDVQSRCRGDMADDGRERFHIHTMLQRHGCEGMPQIMEANLFALRPLQGLLHPAADEVGCQGTILFHWRREHPPGVHRRFVVFQDFQQSITNKEEVMFIGDSEVDVQTGINASLLTIACTWGFRTRDQLNGASYFADKPEDILSIVKEINNGSN